MKSSPKKSNLGEKGDKWVALNREQHLSNSFLNMPSKLAPDTWLGAVIISSDNFARGINHGYGSGMKSATQEKVGPFENAF